jgi:hypothetical protein
VSRPSIRVPVSAGYESVPVVRRPRWGRIAWQALVVVVALLAVWSLVARGATRRGPDQPGSTVALVTSCDRTGPVSRGGIGFYWSCTANVISDDGRTRSARFGLDELTPDDIGKPVPVIEVSDRWQRKAATKVVWWGVAPGIAFFVGIGAWSALHRRKRLRHRVEPWRPTARLVASTCVLAAGTEPGHGRGKRKITPDEWSAQRYWRTAACVMVPGGIAAVAGSLTGNSDARGILITLGLFGLAAPIWLSFLTPRAYRSNANATAVTVSADGFGWYRRGETTFVLDWADVAEVRLLTVTHDGLVLRVVDVFLARGSTRRRELRGLWELGADLGGHRLPGETGADHSGGYVIGAGDPMPCPARAGRATSPRLRDDAPGERDRSVK